MNMEESIKELQFAKDHGACAILKKGDLEAGKWPADPYFYPLYEEANRLDLPICVHIGSGTPDFVAGARIFLRLFYAFAVADGARLSHDNSPSTPGKISQAPFWNHRGWRSWIPFLAWELNGAWKRPPKPAERSANLPATRVI